MMPLSRLKFLDADYEVPINTTAVDGSEFVSNAVSLGLARFASLTIFVKGDHASCSAEVVFRFAGFDSLRNQWDTIHYLEVKLTMTGTTPAQKTITIDPDVEKLKLLSVQNPETTEDYTVDVNASIFLK